MSEIYAGVCVDAREFEIIHGVEKDEVDDLQKYFNEIYEKMTTWQPAPEHLV
nr:hypothetical protein [Neisseria lactamica]